MDRHGARVAAGVVAALVALAAFAALGRWERGHNASVQNARMRAVFAAATGGGSLYNRRLDRYRLSLQFDCLLYAPPGRSQDASAYELCFNRQGTLVQTIDRHTGTPAFSSLLEEPGLARIHVPVPVLEGILEKIGAFATDPRLVDVTPDPLRLPVTNDNGAFAVSRPFRGRAAKPGS